MKVSRDFATSLTVGAFLLMSVTGVLMFFHLDMGLNKTAHEWTGLVLVTAVALHIMVNFVAFKRYFRLWQGRVLIGTFTVLLVSSFVFGGSGKPPYIVVVDELAARPLSEILPLTSEAHLARVLTEAGLTTYSHDDTLVELTQGNFGVQMVILEKLLVEH